MNRDEVDREARLIAITFFTFLALAIAGCFYCLSDPGICKWLRNVGPVRVPEQPITVNVTVAEPVPEPVEVPVAVAEVSSEKDFEIAEPAPKPELTPEHKKAIADQVKKAVADAVAKERRRAAEREMEEKIVKYAVKSFLGDDDDSW
jgi:hypothetical protein